MKNIADMLFEARMLKETPRSGYQFLGSGRESVAEHSFVITFIGFVMSRLRPDVNALKLISMCILHDLPEARTGDLNYVNKQYVAADESKAVKDATDGLPFGDAITGLISEFNDNDCVEAELAHDADQLAFIIDLKAQMDIGHKPPAKWLPHVVERLKTDTGKAIAEEIMEAEWDRWWLQKFVDGSDENT